MAGSVFIAFLSGLTNTAYTATQYALFSSIMTLPGKLISGSSGWIVDTFQAARYSTRNFGGCARFFIYTAMLGIPRFVLANTSPPAFRKKPLPS